MRRRARNRISVEAAPPRAASARRRQVLALVRMIPPGRVATYGDIARLVPGVTARLVGFMMAGAGSEADLPWHRVVNARGAVSPHAHAARQRQLLEAEGIRFAIDGRFDLARHRWRGPDPGALAALGLDPLALMGREDHG
ncbi:MAG: hypothetical protein KatS3mg119_2147 [Rhodothalassiaceae bacterium]|nr:MAG: hypothetical protein KatS3mg119_2147 [Rhodothalassiaceae bacterium]